MFCPCSKLGIFMYWTGNSMDNLLSYCGLVDARISIQKKRFTCTWSISLILSKHWIKEIQVNLCQKLLFLHQLTHNMTTDCSLNYQFSTWKFQAQNTLRTCFVHKFVFVFTFRIICVHNMFWQCLEFSCTELVIQCTIFCDIVG